jgi:hypothetical protein
MSGCAGVGVIPQRGERPPRHCVRIEAGDGTFEETFRFLCGSDGGAWYELDGEQGLAGGSLLKIRADREVYAVYASPDGEERYGIVGDEEDEVLADNFPFLAGERYLFRERPETEEYYV